jgi:hypothetical protein
MIITFHPMRGAAQFSLTRAGDTIVIDGETYDFAALSDGQSLPRSAIDGPWFAGPVERVAGVLHIPLILPHGPNAPHTTRFAPPMTIAGDGPVTLPAFEETRIEEATE